MDLLIGLVAGVFAGVLANYISPRFSKAMNAAFGWAFNFLNPDAFDLSGTWDQSFDEPSPEDPATRRTETERVVLTHIGSVVSGRGESRIEKRQFEYDLRVKHNLVFGSYVKVGEKGNITGHGMIQLIVSPDRLSMEGQGTWFDKDTESIESSPVAWDKVA